MLLTAWRWIASGVTLAAICCAIAYGIMRAFSSPDGPVIDVIKGPGDAVRSVPYGGAFTYTLTTRRMESCPGTVVRSFTQRGPDSTGRIEYSQPSSPVPPSGIRKVMTGEVTITLPKDVTPGMWIYAASVDSTCPLRHRVDELARFPIEVLPNEVLP